MYNLLHTVHWVSLEDQWPRELSLKKELDSLSLSSFSPVLLHFSAGTYRNVYTEVRDVVKKVHKSLAKLDEIALRKSPLTEVEYLQLQIESEKSKVEPAWIYGMGKIL